MKRAESIDRTKERPGPYMLHPHSVLRQRWDVCTVVIIAYSAVAIPFDVAFTAEMDPPTWLMWFNYCLDAFFWCVYSECERECKCRRGHPPKKDHRRRVACIIPRRARAS